jgi:hypothetical protein
VDRSHIEALKAAADPAGVAAALGLRSRGKRFFCPACQSDGLPHKTPDLVTSDKGFICHKCGLKGDLLKLVEVAGRLDFKDAVAFMERHTGLYSRQKRDARKGGYGDKGSRLQSDPGASWGPFSRAAGGNRSKSGPAGASGRSRPDLVAPSRAAETPDPAVCEAFLDACRPVEGPALAWLKAKVPDLPDALVKGLRLRFCGREYLDLVNALKTRFGEGPLLTAGLLKRSKTGRAVPSFWHYFTRKAGFLVIPYLKQGRPVYLKTRPPVSKDKAERLRLCRFLNTAAGVPCLYNVDALKGKPGRVFICEGESDTWTALSRGEAAVGSPGARQFKAAWVEGFRGLADVDGRSTVFLVMDSDPAGIEGAAQVADLFLKAGLPIPRRVMLPPGTDLSDYFAGHTSPKPEGAKRAKSQ